MFDWLVNMWQDFVNWCGSLLNGLWEWLASFISWLFSPQHLLDLIVSIVGGLCDLLQSVMPGAVGIAIGDFKTTYLNDTVINSMATASCWLFDQVCGHSIIVAIFWFWLVFVPVSYIIRLTVWLYHQIWGSN